MKHPLLLLLLLILIPSALAMPTVYCDWSNNAGNPLCAYSGHWWDDSSRNYGIMSPGSNYYDVPGDADVCSDDYDCSYEEEDAMVTAGVYAEIKDLDTVEVAFTAGAMDWNGRYCDSPSAWNCNVFDIRVTCNSDEAYDSDPCFGVCSMTRKTSTCDTEVDSDFQVRIYAEADTEDQYGDNVDKDVYAYYYLDIACTSDADCNGGECKISSDRQSTYCASCDRSPQCTDTKRECISDKTYNKYGKATACDGGCQGDYNLDREYSCDSGQYCSGTSYGGKPCYDCSTQCDGVCQSSACYGIDPDCKADGNVNTAICCSDSDCGSYQKCGSDNSCQQKSCPELGYYVGECGWNDDLANDGECLLRNGDVDVFECHNFGDINCWLRSKNCLDNQECVDDTFAKATCEDHECSLDSSYWDVEDILEGNTAWLTASGEYCSGKTATFEVWESDCPSLDFQAQDHSGNLTTLETDFDAQNWKDYCPSSRKITTLQDVSFSNNQFRVSWDARYEADIIGKPDYYFNVLIDGSELTSSSNFLRVERRCVDADGDGYTDCDGDCNDNDYFINPGMPELCNNIDDNCDGISDVGPNVCGEFSQCRDGACQQFERECDISADCPNAGFVDSPFCVNNDVYQKFNVPSCIEFQCNYITQNNLIESCAAGCSNGACISSCGDGVCSSNENCPRDCIELTGLSLADSDGIIQKNHPIQLNYLIKNKGDTEQKVGLGASLLGDSEINDLVNDDVKVIPPHSQQWYSRLFDRILEFKTYDVAWGLHEVDEQNDFVFMFDHSQPLWQPDAITIIGCGDAICQSAEDQFNCAIDCQSDCTFPYGSSPSCSCFQSGYDCPSGFSCSSDGSHGSCVAEESEYCDYMPDGSSQLCECRGDWDCEKFNEDYECKKIQPYWACGPKVYQDLCELDDLKCENNILYRCEQFEKFNDWKKELSCTESEFCSTNQATCIQKGDYDLIIDSSPSSVVVNKIPQSVLSVEINTDGFIDSSLDLVYDEDAFSIIDNDCLNILFPGGHECFFRVEGLPGESHVFSFGQDQQRVNIIKDPLIAYVTHHSQLKQRYRDDRAVSLLIEKLHEEASSNFGIVIDLEEELNNVEYYIEHPFDTSLSRYSEDRLFPKNLDNTYTDQVARYVQDHLSNVKNIVIVGDDYVVPHRRDIYSIKGGSLAPWLRGFYNSIKAHSKYVNFLLAIPTFGTSLYTQYQIDQLDDDIVVKGMFTDQHLVQRETQTYSFSELDYVFRGDDVTRGNQVKFLMPNEITPELNTALSELKQILVEKELVGSFDHFEEIPGSSITCNDFQELNDAWFLDPGDLPIVLGTHETNPVYNCYPSYKSHDTIDTITIEPSVWDPHASAILFNTQNAEIITSFANDVIATGTYSQLHGRGYKYFHDSIVLAGIIMIPVSFAAGAGVAAIQGTVLIIDAGVIAVEAFDNCYYRGSVDGASTSVIECAASLLPGAAYGAGKGVKLASDGIKKHKFLKAASGVSGTSDEVAKIMKASANIAATADVGDMLKIIPSNQYDRFASMLGRHAGSAAETAKFTQTLQKILQKSTLRQATISKHPSMIDLIGEVVKRHVDSGDEVHGMLSTIVSADSGKSFEMLKIIDSSNGVWDKLSLMKLNGLSYHQILSYNSYLKTLPCRLEFSTQGFSNCFKKSADEVLKDLLALARNTITDIRAVDLDPDHFFKLVSRKGLIQDRRTLKNYFISYDVHLGDKYTLSHNQLSNHHDAFILKIDSILDSANPHVKVPKSVIVHDVRTPHAFGGHKTSALVMDNVNTNLDLIKQVTGLHSLTKNTHHEIWEVWARSYNKDDQKVETYLEFLKSEELSKLMDGDLLLSKLIERETRDFIFHQVDRHGDNIVLNQGHLVFIDNEYALGHGIPGHSVNMPKHVDISDFIGSLDRSINILKDTKNEVMWKRVIRNLYLKNNPQDRKFLYETMLQELDKLKSLDKEQFRLLLQNGENIEVPPAKVDDIVKSIFGDDDLPGRIISLESSIRRKMERLE